MPRPWSDVKQWVFRRDVTVALVRVVPVEHRGHHLISSWLRLAQAHRLEMGSEQATKYGLNCLTYLYISIESLTRWQYKNANCFEDWIFFGARTRSYPALIITKPSSSTAKSPVFIINLHNWVRVALLRTGCAFK